MKKTKALLIFTLLLFMFFSVCIKADCKECSNQNTTKIKTSEESEEDNGLSKENALELQKVYDDNEKSLEELYKYIDELKTSNEILYDLEPEEYVKSYIKNGKGNMSAKLITDAVISLIFKEVSVVLKFGISIIAIGILCSLIKNLQDSFSSKGISEIAFYACYTVVIILITRSFLISIEVAKQVICDTTNFMNAILPILVSLTALSGGVIEASTLDPVVLSVVVIVPKIYKDVIIPLVLISFVLQFVNNLSSEQKIDNLCKMIKKITLWIQGLLITVSISIVAIRGLTSNTLDAVTLKTTKFAVDNFIPIVGKSFSDAITSVASYSLVIKNAVSAIGLFVIIMMILYPVIKMVLMIFIYKLAAAIIEPISDKRIVNAVSQTGECMVVLLSGVLAVSLMFFILIGVMASTSRFIILS